MAAARRDWFAKAFDVKEQVHYVVSRNIGFKDLLADVSRELHALADAVPTVRDTTLLMVPDGLADFIEFNEFLAQANRLLSKLGFEGVLQIASMHPQYQFADAPPDAVTNFTNRAPYPTLHLLREASIDRAVQAFAQPERIFEANMRTLERLGVAGWQALDVGASPLSRTEP
jgi:uncharacterized protein